MTFAEFLGIVAFVLAGGQGIYQFVIHKRQLKIYIQYVEVFHQQDAQSSIILLHLAFENPSSAPKTVSYVTIVSHYRFLRHEQLHIIRDKNEAHKLVLVDKATGNQVSLFADELLQLPLDIPPHESRSKFYHISINWLDFPHLFPDKSPLKIEVQACNYRKRELASASITLALEQLKHSGIYFPSLD